MITSSSVTVPVLITSPLSLTNVYVNTVALSEYNATNVLSSVAVIPAEYPSHSVKVYAYSADGAFVGFSSGAIIIVP